MKRLTLLMLFATSPLLTGAPVQETAREFSAAADFNGDGFFDVLVLDKTSGLYRIGYSSANGTLTFAEARPAGLGTVTGCAVGKLSGVARDSFAVTTPAANRAHILSPQTTGYTEPKEALAAGTGAKLLGAFDMAGGPSPTPEDDLACFATLDPVMGTQLRALRSNAGTWTLLNQSNVPEGDIAHGNPLTPATAATPLFAYVSDDGGTNGFHAWELTGVATTEVLSATGLPAGTEFVAAAFESPRVDVLFFTPGQPTVRVRRILPGAPWMFSAAASFTFSGPIEQLAAVNDLAGPKVLARFTNGSLALFGYTLAGGFSAPQVLTPTGAAGVLSGIVPLPGNAFHLLMAPATGMSSTTALRFQNNGTGWTQTAIAPLSVLRPLAANANVMLLADGPFRTENVAVVRNYRTADWSTGVTVGGGPFTVNAQSGSYGGATQGIGTPSPQALGTATGAPGGTAVNQQHPQFSIFTFNSTLGSAVEDVTIAPDPGTYATAVQIRFTGMSGSSTVFFRSDTTMPFAAWSAGTAPWIFSPATVDYYVRTSAGSVSPTHSARYEFSKSPALQDLDGDGVPDFVEIGRGLNPAGGPDSDGDGVSDRDEIAAETNPNNAGSKPATAAPALNTMLVDISARLQNTNDVTPITTGTPADGVEVTLHDPFGNPAGHGIKAGIPKIRVTASGVLPEFEYLVARTPEHFDVTPANGNARHGREMIAIIPVTPAEPWSFGATNTGLPIIQTAWSWGGVNWLAGSTNWNTGLGAADGFDADWSTSQLEPEWGSLSLGYTFGAWEIDFRDATNRGAQPYADVTLTPITSITALITGKLIGNQLASRAGVIVDGTSLVFDAALTPIFHGLRLPDSAHPAAPAFRIQSLLRDMDTALAATDPGTVALRKIARSVYVRHEALAPANLAALPMPLVALSTFINTGALPAAYDLAGTGLTPGDLNAANARLAALAAALTTRPGASFTLLTRSTMSPHGLTLVQNAGGTDFALFDSSLAATALPANLPPGTPLLVIAYTDLPNVAGVAALEVISLQLTALPFLVGDDTDGDLLADEWELRFLGSLGDTGTHERDGSGYSLAQEYLSGTDPNCATSSPLLPRVAMELTGFRISPAAGLHRLSVHWPDAYADAITVSFDTSPNLTNWTDDPAFSGGNTGNGNFTRDITLTGPRVFFRPHARLKP